MIIDSHTHISYLKKKKEFSEIKNELLLNMEEHKINYSIVIPDNVSGSKCADIKTVMDLIKNESKLSMIGTLKITQINEINLLKVEE